MAVNNDQNNRLYAANDTAVKFFSSLTRRQARGEDDFIYEGETSNIQDFPGAICFVSDASGNSIFLNSLLFGDGATPGGGGGGGGITEVSLDIIPVVTVNGVVLKTLADYFSANGTFITDSLVVNSNTDPPQEIISISQSGITINGISVATVNDLNTAIQNESVVILAQSQAQANAAEAAAKTYADSLVSSVYRVKGTVQNYEALQNIQNPKGGDVYNVINAQGDINSNNYVPPGTNYVYVEDGVNSYWDPLGGTLDLSIYVTNSGLTLRLTETLNAAKDYTDTKVSDLAQTVTANSNSIQTINNDLTTIRSSIQANATNIATNTENITQNTTNITNISTQLTWQ